MVEERPKQALVFGKMPAGGYAWLRAKGFGSIRTIELKQSRYLPADRWAEIAADEAGLYDVAVKGLDLAVVLPKSSTQALSLLCLAYELTGHLPKVLIMLDDGYLTFAGDVRTSAGTVRP